MPVPKKPVSVDLVTTGHLEHPDSYIRMLFIGFSSAFNTIVPDVMIHKLLDMGLSPSISAWVKDFLTNSPQCVRLSPHISSSITLSTGTPQGCVLSPMLYSLYTSDCTTARSSNILIKQCGVRPLQLQLS